MYRHARIDIAIVAAGQGRGLGTDAVRTVARWLIERRGHHRLIIDPSAENARAIAAYAKVGFRPVGTHPLLRTLARWVMARRPPDGPPRRRATRPSSGRRR